MALARSSPGSVDIIVKLVLDQRLDDVYQVPHQLRLFHHHLAKDQHTHQDVDDVVEEGVEGGVDPVVDVKVLVEKNGDGDGHAVKRDVCRCLGRRSPSIYNRAGRVMPHIIGHPNGDLHTSRRGSVNVTGVAGITTT